MCEKTLGYGSFSQTLLKVWTLGLFGFSHLTRVLDSVFCKDRRTVTVLFSAPTPLVLCNSAFGLGFPAPCCAVQQQHLFSCFSLDATSSLLRRGCENCYQILSQRGVYCGAVPLSSLCSSHLVPARSLEGNFRMCGVFSPQCVV